MSLKILRKGPEGSSIVETTRSEWSAQETLKRERWKMQDSTQTKSTDTWWTSWLSKGTEWQKLR